MNSFEEAIKIGRPPNIQKLFPNSKAMIVSGKYIDLAMMKKNAVAIAANARNFFVVKGVLKAAQKANSAVIIEIARTEGGKNAYCGINFWNMARIVDALCNEMGITVPVAIHADHFVIKKEEDIEPAREEIKTLFDAGITSIAIDGSHMTDDKNLIANIKIKDVIPSWVGYETEIGEIKGKEGLSTKEEAIFLSAGLNAYGIFPNWIALNNGTTHGIEKSEDGIQIELTAEIHNAIAKYGISGAQHGTSGNSYDKLKQITLETKTTKANVATAFQMMSWGVEVNEYGNAVTDSAGNFIKKQNEGVSPSLWKEMTEYANKLNFKLNDFRKINSAFENKLLSEPIEIRERMASAVEEFALNIMKNVFNSVNTADIFMDILFEKKSFDAGNKAEVIEDIKEWSFDKIKEKALSL